MKMLTNKNDQSHIIIVGAGGTGGWLASFLNRVKDDHEVTIIDADIVEKKNLVRQNFIEQDINKNKAEVIGSRYEFDHIVPFYLSDSSQLEEVVRSSSLSPIIIGAVDNNASRLIIKQFLDSYDSDVLWVDSGNSERDGQVIVTGLDENGNYIDGFSDPFTLHPELEDTTEDNRHPDDISCAEQSESAPQNVGANIFAATTIFGILNKWLAKEPLLSNEIKFNSATVSMYQYEVNK